VGAPASSLDRADDGRKLYMLIEVERLAAVTKALSPSAEQWLSTLKTGRSVMPSAQTNFRPLAKLPQTWPMRPTQACGIVSNARPALAAQR
jgi:hypothetical protein